MILMQTQNQTLVLEQIVVIAAALLHKSVLASSKDRGLHSTQVGD